MNAFLSWLWQAALAGSAAVVLTLFLVPLIRKWLGAQAAFPAWGFALALFVSPWIFRSPVSVLPPASELPPVVVRMVVPPQPVPPSVAMSSPRRSEFPWGFTLWAAGAAGFSLLALVRLLRTYQLVRRSIDVTSRLQGRLEGTVGLPARTKIRESPSIASPAVCGLLRPVILLPSGWADRKADLRWILLHETGHIRRGDLLWLWAFQIVRIIHWFNPFVWLAERTARVDQEMACDEWVLARGEDGTEYGEAILRAARQPVGGWFIRAGMAESKSGLTRRIRHLAAAHPRGFWFVAFTLLLGVAALLLFSPPRPAPKSSQTAASPESRPPSGPLTQVEIEAKFVEVSPEIAEEIFGAGKPDMQTILETEKYQELLRSLNEREGVDLVSAPKVTTKAGRRATIQIVREFPFPTEFTPPTVQQSQAGESFVAYRVPATPTAFETQNVGLTLEVEPNLTADNRVICALSPRVVEFLGFVNYGSDSPGRGDAAQDAIEAALQPVAKTEDVINQPVFRTREMQTTVILRSGQTVLLGGLSRKDRQALAAMSRFPADKNTQEVERVLYVFVTARLMDAQGYAVSASTAAAAPPASPTQTAPAPSVTPSIPPPHIPLPQSSQKDLPYGTPVPGKPGYVTSPWAPDKGYVDLRGFPPGTEVKCPYTGKLFLAP